MPSARALLALTASAAITLAALLAVSPAVSAASPAAAGIELPRGVSPVWLVSDEYQVTPGGGEQHVATVYQLDQRLMPSARKVERHFKRLARKLGWDGELTRQGKGVRGHWKAGDTTVDVIVEGAGSDRRISLAIRIGS